MEYTSKKILLLLLTGLALGFSYSPSRYFRTLKAFAKDWKQIDEEKLKRAIRDLYRSGLVVAKENSDGSYTYVLSSKGKTRALTYKVETMEVPKQRWDKKWRVVVFDIPEKLRTGRDALRDKLKKLGFYELQKSVLVCPYECKDEVDFLIAFWNIKKYVRYGILESIDNELHLKKIFGFL